MVDLNANALTTVPRIDDELVLAGKPSEADVSAQAEGIAKPLCACQVL